MEDPWQLLDVTPETPAAETTAAYRRPGKQTHPDQGGSAVAFTRVRNAWEQLLQPATKDGWTEAGSEPGAVVDECPTYIEGSSTRRVRIPRASARITESSTPVTLPVGCAAGWWHWFWLVLQPGESVQVTDPVKVVVAVA